MKRIPYFLVACILISCGTSKDYTQEDILAFQDLKELVVSKNFYIQSNDARPSATIAFAQVANSSILGPGNSPNFIDITGISNKLSVKNDSIIGYFPYFGEQQFGSGHPDNSHQGIAFEDIPNDYETNINEDKHKVTFRFHISDRYRGNEHYTVYITLFSNHTSSIQINSTNRSSIEFIGTWKLMEEEIMVLN